VHVSWIAVRLPIPSAGDACYREDALMHGVCMCYLWKGSACALLCYGETHNSLHGRWLC
jgi:hypothetical protein